VVKKKPESFLEWINQVNELKEQFLEQPLIDALNYWREFELRSHTSSYKRLIDEMIERGIFPQKFSNGPDFNIGAIKHIKQSEVIDYIKKQPDWGNTIKDEAIHCYKRFIYWLGKYSLGDFSGDSLFHQPVLWNEEDEITFMKWRAFVEKLGKNNKRDELIARTLLQGKKRVSEVITLSLNNINFSEKTIEFKTKKKHEIIEYEATYMQELQDYITSTQDVRKNNQHVFITRTGKPVSRRRLNYSFNHACNQIKINRINPDSIRFLWNKFKKDGYSASALMQSKEVRIQEGAKEMLKRYESINQETSQ
jgi:integrase